MICKYTIPDLPLNAKMDRLHNITSAVGTGLSPTWQSNTNYNFFLNIISQKIPMGPSPTWQSNTNYKFYNMPKDYNYISLLSLYNENVYFR